MRSSLSIASALGLQRINVVGSYWLGPNHIIAKANEPGVLSVRTQSTVTPHTFVIDTPEAGIRNGALPEPSIARFTNAHTYSYSFYCDKHALFVNHCAKDMNGMLGVTE